MERERFIHHDGQDFVSSSGRQPSSKTKTKSFDCRFRRSKGCKAKLRQFINESGEIVAYVEGDHVHSNPQVELAAANESRRNNLPPNIPKKVVDLGARKQKSIKKIQQTIRARKTKDSEIEVEIIAITESQESEEVEESEKQANEETEELDEAAETEQTEQTEQTEDTELEGDEEMRALLNSTEAIQKLKRVIFDRV